MLHPKMKVRSGRASRRSDLPDALPLPNVDARFDAALDGVKMSIMRLISVWMADGDEVPIGSFRPGPSNSAVGRRDDWCPCRRRKVHAIMRHGPLQDGMDPPRVELRADHIITAGHGEDRAAQRLPVFGIIFAFRIRRAKEGAEHARPPPAIFERVGAAITSKLSLEPLFIEDDAEGIAVARIALEIRTSAEDFDEDADDPSAITRRLYRVAE